MYSQQTYMYMYACIALSPGTSNHHVGMKGAYIKAVPICNKFYISWWQDHTAAACQICMLQCPLSLIMKAAVFPCLS